MIRFTERIPSFLSASAVLRDPSDVLAPPITVCFLLGTFAGVIFGTYSDSIAHVFLTDRFFSETFSSADFAASLWHSLRYLFGCALLSTSYLGIVILPLLASLRGFSLACSASSMFGAEGLHGLLHAALQIGIPSLFAIPGFLIACSSSFCASNSLRPVFRYTGDKRRHSPSLKRFALILLFAFLEFLCHWLFLPMILDRFFA